MDDDDDDDDDDITPELIRKLGREMHGSSGPSGMDSDSWCRMLICYKTASNRLCSVLAAAARSLSIESFGPDSMVGFTSARLIPLNKRPGVRPIAVGEVPRRLIGRATAKVVELDVLRVTAPLQTCAGVPSACEAAVHSMPGLFEKPGAEGVLLVDASNAFNALNRKAALHNIPRICPALAKIFANTYSTPIRLFVSGGGEVLSQEGTCQGDPLAMAIYAIAVTPLIKRLGQACPSVVQSWYADDDSAADTLASPRHYWDTVKEVGPGYGYYPNPTKTVLVTKPAPFSTAQEIFQHTGVAIKSDGARYLGGALGSVQYREACVTARLISGWRRFVHWLKWPLLSHTQRTLSSRRLSSGTTCAVRLAPRLS